MYRLPPDPWQVLGIEKSADKSEIRTAYRKWVLKCHPDRHQNPTIKAQKQDEFYKVKEAYELLYDDAERAAYERMLRIVELAGKHKPAREVSNSEMRNSRRQTQPLEPPITKATLSELDVNKIVHNPKLRHDINFDPELHFRPNLDGEKGRKKQDKANQFYTLPITPPPKPSEKLQRGRGATQSLAVSLKPRVPKSLSVPETAMENGSPEQRTSEESLAWNYVYTYREDVKPEDVIHRPSQVVDNHSPSNRLLRGGRVQRYVPSESKYLQTSNFSSGRKQYFVEGSVGLDPLEAFPDSGADLCLISPDMASSLKLDVVPGTERSILLANKKSVQSPGMVSVTWTFSGETRAHRLECWILPGCLHPLILGREFLRATRTLTKFVSRIKSRLVGLSTRLRLRLLGQEKQRLWGYLGDHLTAALPDTGSDLMLVSRDYARKIGLNIDHDPKNRLEVEFANGSTAWTMGVARNVSWSVGEKTVRCDFHILDDLCVDVVLSNDYLFGTRVFSENSDCFFDTESKDELFQLCNIRLIGRFSEGLNGIEDEYIEDVTSPDAFSPYMVSREVARRDQIRDKINALPEDQREAAGLAEAERQRRWQALREEYRLRWAIGPSRGSLSACQAPGQGTVTDRQPTQRTWWKKRISVHIPLRNLRGSERLE